MEWILYFVTINAIIASLLPMKVVYTLCANLKNIYVVTDLRIRPICNSDEYANRSQHKIIIVKLTNHN